MAESSCTDASPDSWLDSASAPLLPSSGRDVESCHRGCGGNRNELPSAAAAPAGGSAAASSADADGGSLGEESEGRWEQQQQQQLLGEQLLGRHHGHDEQHGGHHHGMAGGTVTGAVFNLSNTIIGAGIMGLPGTFKVLGVPLGLATLMFVGIVSEYALQRMLKCTVYTKSWSFGDLLSETYGEFGRSLLRLIILINNCGILVVYFIVIGDVLSGSDDGSLHYPGLLEEWTGGSFWWTSRPVVLLTCTATVIAPLVSLQHIDSLKFSSLLSIMLAVIFIVITVVITLINLIKGTIDWSQVKMLPTVRSSADVWQLFTIIPTMATAFTCHYNMHPILVELQPPREPKMSLAMRLTLMLCTAVYCVTALFGYMLFGSDTSSDILANFDRNLGVPYSEVVNDVVRLFYALHLLLVFPVIHYSLRTSVDAIVFPRAKPFAQDKLRFFYVTFFIVGGIFTLSILVPDIQFAFEFMGSIGAATLALTFPGMIALSDRAGASTCSSRDTFFAWCLLLLGLTVTFTGLADNFYTVVVKS